MTREDVVSVGQARDILGVSKQKMADLLKRGVLHVEDEDELDKRIKWILRSEVEALAAKSPSAPKIEAAA